MPDSFSEQALLYSDFFPLEVWEVFIKSDLSQFDTS